jgi:streptomycin 6-kinase
VEPWWERLPEAVDELAARWELVVDDPVGRGNTSLVLRCRRADGRAAILKLGPDAEIARAEAGALRSWESSGRVPLVWGYDPAFGALLLEAIPSETPLSELRAVVELGDVADLIGALHRSAVPAVAGRVTSLANRVEFTFDFWVERFGSSAAATGAVPTSWIERGRNLARSLAADGGAPVLLHGDLHPGNVLCGGDARGLVAIDPRPCVGDPAFDAVDWIFWPVAEPGVWAARSVELASVLGCDSERLWSWCAAFAPLLAAREAACGGAAELVEVLLALAP